CGEVQAQQRSPIQREGSGCRRIVLSLCLSVAGTQADGQRRARPVVNGTSQPDLLFETSWRCKFATRAEIECLAILDQLIQLEGVADRVHHSVLQHRVDTVARLPSRWVLGSLQSFVWNFLKGGSPLL